MASPTVFFFFFSVLSLALTLSVVSSRGLSPVPPNNPVLISDGVHDGSSYKFLTLDRPKNLSGTTCVHVYGFLPCAENVGGYIFQVLCFGGLLIIGDYFLSQGRSKLLLIFEVGFYGGIIFPLLTMLPRIVLMLSTGLSLSSDVANAFIGDNVAVTVGYTVFALTVQWGACVVFSITGPTSDQSVRRTTTDGRSQRQKTVKSLFEASVEADPKNKKTAGIMLLSLTPFLMMTLFAIFDSHSWSRIILLIILIISSSSTIVYFVYSYFDKPNQEKSLDKARFELMSEVHKHLQKFSPKNLIKGGELSKESLRRKIQISELKDLTIEFWNFGRMKCDINELAKAFLEDFDGDKDGELTEEEFEEGIKRLLKEYKLNFDNVEDQTQRENLTEEEQVLKMQVPKQSLVTKLLTMEALGAVIEVILGILIAMIPMARNLKNTLSTRFCRGKDKKRISSDTFSEIYKEVTMNNLMGMSIILAIVYTRGLTWSYSMEALIIVIVGLVIGLPVYTRSTYSFWICVLAFAMYFLSLLLIYLRHHFLDN